jgi:hypothetical protein
MASAVVAPLVACADHSTPSASPAVAEATVTRTTPGGRVGSHTMIVFGGLDATFFSHIPLFGPPHDVQLVMQVKLDGGSLPRTFQDRLYTFVPETMSLDDVIRGTKTDFTGRLYLGNVEQNGRLLLSNVRVRVTNVAFSRNLDRRATEPPNPDYLFIGKAPNTTRVRIIHSPASVDEIVPFSIAAGSSISDADLESGVILTAQSPVRPPTDVASPPVESYSSSSSVTLHGTSGAGLSCLEGPDYFSECR